MGLGVGNNEIAADNNEAQSDNSEAGSDNNGVLSVGNIQSSKNYGINTIFIGNIQVNNNIGRSIFGLSFETIKYFDLNGKEKPMLFLTSDGKNVVLQTTNLKQINNKYILFNFSKIYLINDSDEKITIHNSVERNAVALLNMMNGKIYDFTQYKTDNIFIDSDYIYCIGRNNKTVYKIAQNNPSNAIPLNNANFTPVNDNLPLVKIQNKLVIGNISLDIDGNLPPKETNGPMVFRPIGLGSFYDIFNNMFKSNLILTPENDHASYVKKWFFDDNGDIWVYQFYTGVENSDNLIEKHFFAKFKLLIDSEGNITYTDYEEIELPFFLNSSTSAYNVKVFKIREKAHSYNIGNIFYTVKINDNGIGITNEYFITSSNIPVVGTLIDGYIYYQNGTSIHKFHLVPGGIDEIVFSDANILKNSLVILERQLFFHKYVTATTVNTYYLSIDNLLSEPQLMSENKVEIKDIIELIL